MTILCQFHPSAWSQTKSDFILSLSVHTQSFICFNGCQILETVAAATCAISCYMRAYFQVSLKAVCLNLEALNSPFSTMNMAPPTFTVVVHNCNPRIWRLKQGKYVKCQPWLQKDKHTYV